MDKVTKVTILNGPHTDAIPVDDSYTSLLETVKKDDEYEMRNRGRISCSSDGSIEKYIGNGSCQTIIPEDVMLKAVKIALNKIKEEEDNA